MKSALGFVWWCITCVIAGFAVAGLAAIFGLNSIAEPLTMKAGDGQAAAMLLFKIAAIASFIVSGVRLIFGSRPALARQFLEHTTVGGQ